ncbi:uncharacterized protein ACLA_052410 [Aspergillus clavatus NRRL 1]|uniref:C-x8-C-x5-C-x3-H type zinc finger protein n=1 Tax=Aspergillus clavatus (strain ATCC 1007 / CBS 513.65 / DSM 816 / NCTC 3887 / NRRL 1 / QM 1276 / 107) TaxID=344612 RepID=A1CIR3_ASPCL|nr:C-x8-C-x5-C-x3-H type zinc finger protein [Aspergillus clavatus NRRL 1]EAW10768.1 C-x8-C-x5-C-x3-H type zinc finger protein [Aspergillus clavatus NRRL 1]
MTAPLRPQYFCARPNGTLVPLVAVDELPGHVNIRGAPRVLSPGDTQGMTSLGTVAPRCQYYIVDGAAPSYIRYHQTGNGSGNGNGNGSGQRGRGYENQVAAPRYVPEENGMGAQRLASQTMYQPSNTQNWVMANPPAKHGWLVPANVGAGAGHAAANSAGNNRQSGHPKKEYCSYWIRHGECDYQQQGCLFKHEMPTDRAMLEKLGLRDIPRWYRDKYGVPSILSAGGNQSRDSRAQTNSGQGHDDSQERGALKATHHAARLALNAAAEKVDAEKTSKSKSAALMPLALPGKPMLSSNASSPRGPVSSRGSKQASNVQMQSLASSVRGQAPQAQAHTSSPQNRIPTAHNQTSKKIDLLSFDPAPDYASLELNCASQREVNGSEAKERVKREEFLRNLHGMFISTTAPANASSITSPVDFLATQNRTKRSQPKSRRLYQPRTDMPNMNMDTDGLGTSKMLRPSAILYTAAEAIAKETGVNPLLASPGTGFIHGSVRSSESPIRGASSTQSCASSSEPSPRVYGGRIKNEGEAKPLLPPIGTFTHRNPAILKRPAVTSAEDLFDMGMGRAK